LDEFVYTKRRSEQPVSITHRVQVGRVFLFLLFTRLFLILPALFGFQELRSSGSISPNALNAGISGLFARWDSNYYLQIAQSGYSYHGSETAFFPLYPLAIRLGSALLPVSAVTWGYVLSNLFFLLAGCLLWEAVEREHGGAVAWGTIVLLDFFPTSVFFSAIYSESLFLLFSVLVYVFTIRQRYVLAALCAGLAGLTRVNGVFLALIPLAELLRTRPLQFRRRAAALAVIAGLGPALFGAYLWITQGSPFQFARVQQSFERSLTWPWKTVFDSAAVALVGYGGNAANWFMRVVSLEDLGALALVIVSTVLAWKRLRAGLMIYQVVSLIFFLSNHGPYAYGLWSFSRYIVILFPMYMAYALALEDHPRLKWTVWVVSAAALLFVTAWFSGNHWAG
jgi:Gpi18-like mannosyltransferase